MSKTTTYTPNRPDYYVQILEKREDGTTEFKDAAVFWDKPNYASGTLEVEGKKYKVIGRTREQRDALFAMREQQKQQAQSQSQEQSQAPVTDKPDFTPSI